MAQNKYTTLENDGEEGEETTTPKFEDARAMFEEATHPSSNISGVTLPDSPAAPYTLSLEALQNNEMEKSRQTSINPIQFEEAEKDILVKWPDRSDASSHKIQITNGKEVFNRETAGAEFCIKKSEYRLQNGAFFHVRVTVSKLDGNIICVHDADCIVGGNEVPTNFHIRLRVGSSHDTIDAAWNPPKRKPEKHEVTLFRKHDNCVIKNEYVEENKASFSELNEKTIYYCTIKPIYGPTECGKTVISKEIETSAAPKTLPLPRNVKCHLDMHDPSRRIIAQWQAPESGIVKEYECGLYNKADTKHKTDVHKVSATTITFRSLKSDKTFYIGVKACYVNGGISDTVFSEAIITQPVKREHVEIKVLGKPKVTSCTAKCISDKLFSDFSWKCADLGNESRNFELICTRAAYKQKDWIDLEVLNGDQTVPTELSWGQKTAFRVVCQYKDLDSQRITNVESIQEIETIIEKPQSLKASWNKEEIFLQWDTARGAKSYSVKLLNQQKKVVMDENVGNVRNAKFTMKASCRYGNWCTFFVCGEGKVEKKSEAWQEFLIGGDSAVTDVKLEKSDGNSARELNVTWKAPKIEPEKYKLQIYEAEFISLKFFNPKHVETIFIKSTNGRFVDLKSQTKYYCKVTPMYNDQQQGNDFTSESNFEVTGKRVETVNEKSENFGKPDKVFHTIEKREKKIIAILQWSPVQVGSNFKLLQYDIAVEKKSSWLNLKPWANNKVFSKPCDPFTTNVSVDNLEEGNTYEVKISTKVKNLDSLESRDILDTYKFYTDPSTTDIYDCTWKDGVITFLWAPVTGAKTYTLIVKENLGDEDLHTSTNKAKECGGSGKCRKRVQMDGKLGIGHTCRVKIRVVAEGDLESETDWKTQLIGGGNVPRNVKASKCVEDPTRSLNITFDQPIEGLPDSYKITAKPKTGRSKTLIFQHNKATFGHLKRGVEYQFEVQALYGQVASEISESNPCKTDAGSTSKPFISFEGTSGTVDMHNAQLCDSNMNLSIAKDADFGKVRDLRAEVKPKDEKDILTVHWKVPAFDNNPQDYKVDKYILEIRTRNDVKIRTEPVIYKKGEFTYSTCEYSLELGETYHLGVTTYYEDIDSELDLVSSAATEAVHTRPCKPVMLPHVYGEDNVKIEWNDAKGATSYSIEIFVENSKVPLYVTNTMKDKFWTRTFDGKFGYGTCFYAIITAIGQQGKKNASKSPYETIGGKFVPKNLSATITNSKVTDPNTQAFLKWVEPELKPLRYEVTSLPLTEELVAKFDDRKQTCCVVSGLKAGTWYNFKVFGIHTDPKSKQEFKSGGCLSEESVQTNPTPTQVKNIKTSPGKQPSTSIYVEWGRVDAEKDEPIKYRVMVTAEDEIQKSETYRYVATEHLEVGGLVPGQTYFVSVAGGNSAGFGRYSDRSEIQTEFGTPKIVTLTAADASPSTALILHFQMAEGEPTEYFGSLFKYSDVGRQESVPQCKVVDGHIFNDLQPNSRYKAVVHANYGDNEGEAVESTTALTAPAKAVVTEYGCCGVADENSADSFEIKWQSVPGCNLHEVRCVVQDRTESSLIIKDKNEYIYTCQHPMVQYSVQVRSRNESGHFGDWSDEMIIDLAPEALKNISAKLTEEANLMEVKCKKLSRDPSQYCMQAMCNGIFVDGVITNYTMENEDVKFSYEPLETAREYAFRIWAENNLKGKATLSNTISSRPGKGILKEVMRCDNKPSTDIRINWELQDRCDEYEIAICRQGETELGHLMRFAGRDSGIYRCLSPGDCYAVKVRCICKQTFGPWSEVKTIELAPAEVELTEEAAESDHPNFSVEIKWKPLEIKPTGYIATLFCGNEQVDEYKGGKTKHVFKQKLKPGSQCYCMVKAFKGEIMGKPVKSKIYKIIWSKPKFLRVTPDENEPSKRAKISWDKPFGVNQFKLEFENNQNGVKTVIETDKTEHVYESGIPGNTYTVRLYCGCDSNFDKDYREEKMIMKPVPPSNVKVTANEMICGLEVEFLDDATYGKEYKIIARPIGDDKRQICKTTSLLGGVLENLTPGESYKVSVAALLRDTSSVEKFHDGFVQTLPEEIQNLRSTLKHGSIVYQWDACGIKPKEYRVQLQCNDEPVVEHSTQKTSFCKRHPSSGCFYSVRVYAVNKSGSGPISEWETYITDPMPVCDVESFINPKSPETSFIVKYKDDRNSLKRYRITATGQTEGVKEVETQKQYAILTDLVPGEEYSIKVVTLFCGKESEPALFTNF